MSLKSYGFTCYNAWLIRLELKDECMILVTGATGFIGRALVTRLMAEDRAVRLLLPSARQRNLPWDNPPEIITGNQMDDEALFQAVSGVHTIIHLENALWWGRPRDLERVELVGTRNLITAARSARVGRIITLSQLGASPSSAFTLLRTKGELEAILRSSGLAYTIIRSGLVFGPEDAFVNHVAMVLAASPGIFLMPGQGEVILHPIYIDDVIEILVRSLEMIDVVDETVEIGGPEYITFADLVTTVMRVTRAYRAVVNLPPYSMRWINNVLGLGLGRTLVTSQWLDILAASRTASLGNTYSVFKLHPRRFEDTLMGYMPQRRYFFSALRYSLRRRPRES